jgi:hypothetical protein
MPDRLSRVLWGLAVAIGLAAVGLGLSVFVEAWQTSRAWVGSAEALHADLPAEAPVWLDQSAVEPNPVALVAATPRPAGPPTSMVNAVTTGVPVAVEPSPVATSAAVAARSTTGAPLGSGDGAQSDDGQEPVASVPEAPRGLPAASEIELAEVDFRFLDPPEPGAHARLAVTLQSHAGRPTGPLTLALRSRWLQSFQVFGAIPAVLDDRAGDDGDRRYVFGGLGPGERRTLEIHVLASAEEVDAPDVRIFLGDGTEIGQAHPRTVAPRPRPGPARAIAIPKLGVNAAVVPVPWEPPPFVVGQLQGTSAVSEGNTVLVGHLRGPAGDVFARLDRLRPGDEVVATSRGLEYRFVVSEVAVRPYDDVQPTQPTTTPRLTMMTCTGTWSIARQDYSHRLWVVAEPPELAQQTIQANAEKAAQAAHEAEAAAAARATHEAETVAMDSSPASSTVPPTPEATPVPSSGRPDPAAEPADPAVEPTDPINESAAPTPEATAIAMPAASPAPDQGTMVPGIVVEAPTDGAPVSQRLVVRGRRTTDAPAGASLWLIVRADVAGSRWYALDRPLDVRPDGAWEATIELGGSAGIHHEIRVGAVDAMAEAALRRHATEHPGQPLDDLPAGFQAGARVTVESR